MTPETRTEVAGAVEVLRAYVLTAQRDKLGRVMSDRSRLAALDALELLDREVV